MDERQPVRGGRGRGREAKHDLRLDAGLGQAAQGNLVRFAGEVIEVRRVESGSIDLLFPRKREAGLCSMVSWTPALLGIAVRWVW